LANKKSIRQQEARPLTFMIQPGFSQSGTLIAATSEWWLGYDGKRCEIFADKRGGNWNMLGAYPSRHDAEKAKHRNDKCQKD
jgi:hypothetical protein